MLRRDAGSARPALLGGPAVRPEGFPQWPPSWPEVAKALGRALEQRTWGLYDGPNTAALADGLARYHGVEFVELCSSGTFAVELALRALGTKAGDEVIVAGYDFPGNFNDVVAVGARPVVVDIAAGSWQIDASRIEAAAGPATRGIIATHLHGGVVPMRSVVETARRLGLWVVEDACQMPGATIEGRRAGTWGDAGVLSFGGSKLLSSGRGGALLTSSADVRQRARLHCNRGNHAYPLSELQAAVLLPQLEHLDERNAQRAAAIARLRGIEGLDLLESKLESTSPGYYKVGFRYLPDAFGGLAREDFVEAVGAEGIEMKTGFRAFHLSRAARHFRLGSSLDEAEAADRGMIVLHHPVLLEGAEAVEQVVEAVAKIRRHAAEVVKARRTPSRSAP